MKLLLKERLKLDPGLVPLPGYLGSLGHPLAPGAGLDPSVSAHLAAAALSDPLKVE